MSKEEAVYKALLQIQRKHMMYFLQNNTDVYQCVQIVLEPLALPILKHDLPDEIKAEIQDIVKTIW